MTDSGPIVHIACVTTRLHRGPTVSRRPDLGGLRVRDRHRTSASNVAGARTMGFYQRVP
jgi:hypothetical protein